MRNLLYILFFLYVFYLLFVGFKIFESMEKQIEKTKICHDLLYKMSRPDHARVRPYIEHDYKELCDTELVDGSKVIIK